MNTPWGHSDQLKMLEKGGNVVSVSTPSHGGIGVKVKWARENLTAEAIAIGDQMGDWLWYEEDCNWAVVVFEHPNLDLGNFEQAKKSIGYWRWEYCAARGLYNLIDRAHLKKMVGDPAPWEITKVPLAIEILKVLEGGLDGEAV